MSGKMKLSFRGETMKEIVKLAMKEFFEESFVYAGHYDHRIRVRELTEKDKAKAG